jgi:hypothetical protein
VHVDESDVLDGPGERRTFRVKPVDPSKPLRVSLAWTDAPAAPVGGEREPDTTDPAALVNDLDLAVRDGGTVWHGNTFKDGVSQPGGHPDRRNNVENVFLRQAGNGTYEVTVNPYALPGDGVPQRGDTTDQDYALVISNARLLPAADAPPAVAAPAADPAPVASAPPPAKVKPKKKAKKKKAKKCARKKARSKRGARRSRSRSRRAKAAAAKRCSRKSARAKKRSAGSRRRRR